MSKTLPLISVIVPVYGVEAYLHQCVDSIIAQSYENLEIILVDDGSPDKCPSICDEYAACDRRVSVIHKQNGGLSDARNAGLAAAHGEYVSFIDSDDYVSPIFIEALYRAMTTLNTKIAAVPGGHPFHDEDKVDLQVELSAVMPSGVTAPRRCRDYQRLMLYQTLATGAQWRLYAREVLGENPFPVGLYYEDLASTYKFVKAAGDVVLVDCRELYAYRLRPTSIIRQAYSPIKAASALQVSKQLYADISEWCPELTQAVASRCFSVCRMVYAQIPKSTSDGATAQTQADADALWEQLTKMAPIVRSDPQARKRERLAATIACMGRVPFNLFCSACRKAGLLR